MPVRVFPHRLKRAADIGIVMKPGGKRDPQRGEPRGRKVDHIVDFREGEYVDRELVLVKVSVDSRTRAEVMQVTDIFRAKIVDVQPKTLTIEITGDESKVDKFLELMKSFGIVELTRTGKVALPRK